MRRARPFGGESVVDEEIERVARADALLRCDRDDERGGDRARRADARDDVAADRPVRRLARRGRLARAARDDEERDEPGAATHAPHTPRGRAICTAPRTATTPTTSQ